MQPDQTSSSALPVLDPSQSGAQHRPSDLRLGSDSPSAPEQHAGAQTEGLAIAALVLGIVSFPFLVFPVIGLPMAAIAVWFGHWARRDSPKTPSRARAMATSGLAIGWVCGVINLLEILAFAGYFVLLILIGMSGS